MNRQLNSIVFIKSFDNEVKADKFAKEHGGRVEAKYDFDFLKNRVIKTFDVKY